MVLRSFLYLKALFQEHKECYYSSKNFEVILGCTI